MMHKKILLLTATLLSAIANGATILDRSPDTAASVYYGSASVSTSQVFADSFVLNNDYAVTGVDVFAEKPWAFVGQQAYVQFWKGNDPYTADTIAFVESIDAIDSAFTTTQNKLHRLVIQFTMPLNLLANVTYWMSVSGFDSEMGMAGVYNADDNQSVYENSFTGIAPFDLSFKMYGDEILGGGTETQFGPSTGTLKRVVYVQVPDFANTAGLAALAMGGLLFFRRRK